jgi:methyl-accepting chemotaxis protein
VYDERDASGSDVVADHTLAVEAAVTAAFEGLRDEGGDEAAVDRAEAALSATLDELFGSMAAGVEQVDGPRTAADGGPTNGESGVTPEPKSDGGTTPAGGHGGPDPGPETATAAGPDPGPTIPLDARSLFDHVGTCLFVLDAEGNVVVWNRGAEELTGVSAEEAYEADMASEAFYHDGRRAKTLADKVLDAPESADEAYGVPQVEDYAFTLYRDRSTMTDADGDERHISFSAAPLYEGDELVGVVEMVQDRTADTARRERTTDLLVELQSTIEAIQGGDYDARATFEHEGVVDAELPES